LVKFRFVFMESRQAQAKSYNFLVDLQIGHYIDAKDTVNHWCVAEVCDIDNDKNMIKIHFEGWTNRYDEVCPSGIASNCLVGVEEEFLEVGSLPTAHGRLHGSKEDSFQRLQNQLHAAQHDAEENPRYQCDGVLKPL